MLHRQALIRVFSCAAAPPDPQPLRYEKNCASIQRQRAPISGAAFPSRAYSVTPRPAAIASSKIDARGQLRLWRATPRRINSSAASFARKAAVGRWALD